MENAYIVVIVITEHKNGVHSKKEYSLFKVTSGIEVIKPPGRNLDRNTLQKLLHGLRFFLNIL
jgi:hypothetical protein